MVGGVDSALGSSAYVRGSQLGSGSSASRSKAPDKEASQVSFAAEKNEVTAKSPAEQLKEANAASTSNDNGNKSELQARNDDTTLQKEQVRGSLLDIAV